MKKVLFNSSPFLRYLGYFNLTIGLLICFIFISGNISQNFAGVWDSTNKDIEVSADVVLPSTNTIVNTDNGWNSENKTTELPPVITNTNNTSNTNTGKTSGWDSINKEIIEPFGNGIIIGSGSSSSGYTYTNQATTSWQANTNTYTQKEIPTVQISTVKNEDGKESPKIIKPIQASSTKNPEEVESPKMPFYIESKKEISQIQNTMDVFVSLGTTSENVIERAQEIKKEDVNLLYKDTNKDGVSDYDSIYIYNLDPIKASPIAEHEGKKINAGEKILLGMDPLSTSTTKIVQEEPKVSSAKEISTYKLSEVVLTPDKLIVFQGKALPNSFITLYIYSTPVIVTVKADATGEWKYTLNKELEDGQHVVYTATVNNTGKILAKSAPFAFAKTAEAATLIPSIEKQADDMKPAVWNSKYTMMIVVFLVFSILAVLFVVGVGIRKNSTQFNEFKKDDLPTPTIQ
jgi:hypothetical protein